MNEHVWPFLTDHSYHDHPSIISDSQMFGWNDTIWHLHPSVRWRDRCPTLLSDLSNHFCCIKSFPKRTRGWPIGFFSAPLGRQVLDQLAELEAQLNGLKAEKVGRRWLKRLRVKGITGKKRRGSSWWFGLDLCIVFHLVTFYLYYSLDWVEQVAAEIETYPPKFIRHQDFKHDGPPNSNQPRPPYTDSRKDFISYEW